jgi:hypothetical protein
VNAPQVAGRLDDDEMDAISITDSIGRQQIVTVVLSRPLQGPT